MGFQLIKLRLKAFESAVLDKSVKDIVQTLSRINSHFCGPIPMPRKIKKFTFESYGFKLDVLVNNAAILTSRMCFI